LGSGAGFGGSVVGGFAEFPAGVFDCGLCALGGFGDFVASSLVPRALIGIIRTATHTSCQHQRGPAQGPSGEST
jgi:hypothetical protein